ncbi:50S ribosomal protein L10 [bacterium]|nr:50S ribosomal protein L10 [bacterium]
MVNPVIVRRKEAAVHSGTEDFKSATFVALVRGGGLDAPSENVFRRDLKAAGSEMRVIRNTLMRRVLDGLDLSEEDRSKLDEILKGPIAYVIAFDNPFPSVKVLVAVARERRGAFAFLGGLLDGALLEKGGFKDLATLSDISDLYSRVVWAIGSPVSGLVGVLESTLSSLVWTLEEIQDTKGES